MQSYQDISTSTKQAKVLTPKTVEKQKQDENEYEILFKNNIATISLTTVQSPLNHFYRHFHFLTSIRKTRLSWGAYARIRNLFLAYQ